MSPFSCGLCCRCLYVCERNQLLLAATADKCAHVFDLSSGFVPLARYKGRGGVSRQCFGRSPIKRRRTAVGCAPSLSGKGYAKNGVCFLANACPNLLHEMLRTCFLPTTGSRATRTSSAASATCQHHWTATSPAAGTSRYGCGSGHWRQIPPLLLLAQAPARQQRQQQLVEWVWVVVHQRRRRRRRSWFRMTTVRTATMCQSMRRHTRWWYPRRCHRCVWRLCWAALSGWIEGHEGTSRATSHSLFVTAWRTACHFCLCSCSCVCHSLCPAAHTRDA